jgi:Domain of unknown function (DUF4410)
MLRNVLSETTPSTYRQGTRWPRVAGTGVQCALSLLLLGMTIAGFGCAGARVDVAQQAPSDAPQPDFIIVERFGVSPEDVKLDRGLSAQALRGLQERALNDEERKVGAAVATVMEEETVRLLRAAGIPAYLDSYAPTATRTTALLQGSFLSVDEGDRTQRVWLGFGLGGSKLQIKMQVLQGGLIVAEGEVQTTSNLKPGMVASLGIGAATGAIGMAAAIGGGTAVASEALLVSVEADAKRAAKAVAERIIQGYKDRGWLSR